MADVELWHISCVFVCLLLTLAMALQVVLKLNDLVLVNEPVRNPARRLYFDELNCEAVHNSAKDLD